MKKANFAYSVTIIALGIFAGWYALQYKGHEARMVIGADFFPRLMSAGLIITGLIILYKSWRMPPDTRKADFSGMPRVGAFLIGLVLYLWLLRPLGFIVVSVLMVLYSMFLMGCRRWLAMILYSLILPSVIFVMFYYFMYVNLPLGILDPILPKY